MTTIEFSKDRLLTLQQSLINYLRHPVREISNVPDLSWAELVLMQVTTTALTGALTGLVNGSVLSVFAGIFAKPILTAITLSIFSLVLYYVFQLFVGQTLPPRRLMTVTFFAALPFFIFQILSGIFPPVNLLGFAFAGLLMIKGLHDNFQLPRKLVIQVIVGLYVAIFLVWLWGNWSILQVETGWRSDSMDAPEVQLGQ